MIVRFTPAARDDIEDIYRSIARKNPIAAQQVEDLIRVTPERLGLFPGLGARLEWENVRRVPLVRYPFTLFYRVMELDHAVEILRVVHGSAVKDLGQLPD